ncbi:MAG: hypothetical protein IPO36_01955 [Anaerolineales bacterium]|nr:hypothetical protein [Anaerolineales bacterium]
MENRSHPSSIQKQRNTDYDDSIPMGTDEFVIQCDCLLLPMEDGRATFIAEEIHLDSALQEVLERLNKQVKLFQIESEVTKKIARNKQIEMEGYMAQAPKSTQIDAPDPFCSTAA